jgi:putative transposase
VVGPGERKNMAAFLMEDYQVSITRACKVVELPKSMYYYQKVKDDSEVITKLNLLATQKPREGQDKYYQRIRNEGLPWNYKRVRRVYLMLGMNHRRKTKRRIPARTKMPLYQPQQSNESWSMDFMHDTLMNKRKFRVLNIIDDYNRKAINIEADFSFPAVKVIKALQCSIVEHGKPQKIRVDNGPEFISSELTDWCKKENINLQYIQPGKPMQNGYVERFNKSFRQDVLDACLFEDMEQVKDEIETFMTDYNESRPHEALGNKSPNNYVAQAIDILKT